MQLARDVEPPMLMFVPRVIGPDRLAVEAVRIVEQWEVSALIVVDDENRPVGMVHIHEILKAGVA